ncbi:hypothetical protein [Nonomuraea sp. NPDC049758]|uniref:hypothetical protein n=1 Tax=Nonomuraea sp. NPDC049758 TaxID=3154360 RepID=UPI00341B9607
MAVIVHMSPTTASFSGGKVSPESAKFLGGNVRISGVLAVVEVMQYFLVPLVLFNGTGDPGGATRFFNLYLYQTFFTYQEMSYGSTLALVLFRRSRRWVHYTSER